MSFNSNQQQTTHDDFYTFLGIARDASDTEITNAYRKMSRMYHPDKHNDEKKEAANILFDRAKKAYEVLKDPHKRAIYDTLGEEALDSQMLEIVKRNKSPEEIRENYERLIKEKEEKQLKQILNPRSTVTVGVNATNLFKTRRRRNRVKISSMGLTVAGDVPINNRNRMTVTGIVTSQNGKGEHAFSATVKNAISEDLNTEFNLTAGKGAFLKFKGVKNLTKQDHIGTQLVFSPDLMGMWSKEINYVHLLSKYLAFNCALKSDLINDSTFTTSLSYNKEKNKIDLEFAIGIKSSHLSLAYIRSLEINDTKLKTKLKCSLIGASMEYGCETRLTKNSSVDAVVSIGNSNGVSVKMGIIVSNQVYAVDILLSDEVIMGPIVYGTVCPMLAYLCVKKFLIEPYQESKKKQKQQEQAKDNMRKMYDKRREAELSIELMQDAYQRSVETEQTKEYGLVIDLAIYGNVENLMEFVNQKVRDVSNVNLTDKEELILKQLTLVTIPLQCLIKDSILSLPEANKFKLPGFYDPCPEREKKLYIRYRFRGILKEVFCLDNGKLRLPSFN